MDQQSRKSRSDRARRSPDRPFGRDHKQATPFSGRRLGILLEWQGDQLCDKPSAFHTLRKTIATLLADAGPTAGQAADLLGLPRVSMTQDVHFGRGWQSRASAEALAFVDVEGR